MKEDCLFVWFCTYEIHWTGIQMVSLVSFKSSKALDEEGCMGLVPWRLDLVWCKSSGMLNDFFTEN